MSEVGPEGGEKVPGNESMPVAGADHGIGFAADVFMPDLARQFPLEVVLLGNEGLVCGFGHRLVPPVLC